MSRVKERRLGSAPVAVAACEKNLRNQHKRSPVEGELLAGPRDIYL